MAIQADYNSLAQQVYISYFGRPADSLGLSDMTAQLLAANVPVTGIAAADTTAFVNAYSTNATIKTIIDNFGTSTESLSYFGAGSDASFVNAIYLQVLGRAPLLEGLTFWSNALANAQMTRGEAALRIMEGALNNTTAQGLVDAAGIANKTIAADAFTANQLTTADVLGYSGSVAAATARAWLATVTDDAATLTAATASVATTITGINTATAATAAVGTTFALTTGLDSIVGTANNDTISATYSFTTNALDASATLSAGDAINGGLGVDTLNISVQGALLPAAATATTTPSLTGVEKVLVSNVASETAGGDNVRIDLSLADSALTTVGTSASSVATVLTAFTNVGKLVDLQQAGLGDLNVGFTTATVTGTADAVNLALNGTGSSTVSAATTINGVETLNVSSNTLASYATITDAALTTLNVTGSKAATLVVGGNASLVTVDASAATGDVSIDVAGLTLADITVTGGTGTNDTITTASASITASSKLDAVTGFETLAASGAGVTVTLDAAVAGLTTVNLGDAGAQTLTLATGFTGALTVDETDNAGGADTINNTAGATLTVNGAEADITGITITGHATAVDTLNITAGTGDTALTNVTSVDAINVLANATAASTAAKITAANVATGKTMTVNASALTNSSATFDFAGAASQAGAVNVTGATTAVNTIDLTNFAGNNTVTGGSGKDVITGGTGNDNISAGAGNDTITMGANLTANDTIDGGTGTNTLSITSFTDAAILANVTNVQALKLTGNTSVFAPVSSISTFDLSNTSAQVLTLATGYTGATTVTLTGAGATSDSVINSANVALTVNGNVLDLDGTVITGGTSTDILNITADTNTGSLTSVTGVETINVLQNATTATSLAVLTNIAAASGKTVTIDASGMTNASATFGLNTVSGAGSFVVTAATAGGAIDLSGATGAATVTGGAGGDTITLTSGINSISAGAGTDAIVAGATLLNTDVIDGGTGTDTLTATIAGTSATTGAFNIANVETVTLTSTAASTVDATTITGATLLAFANGTGGIKVTGLAAAATVGLGTGATAFTGASNFALTDATGTADVLNIKLNTTAAQTTGVITTTGIETLNITQNATLSATSARNQVLDLSGSTATTINVTATAAKQGGTSNTNTLALGTLNAAAATVDASAVAATTSTFSVTGTNAGAMTFKGSAGVNDITGGGGNDTITIAAGFDGSDVVAGGAGTDTLNATNDLTAITSLANISAIETMNLTVASTAAASTISTIGALDGTALKSFTVTGANPTTALTITGSIGSAGTNLLTSFDASGYAGVVDVLLDGVQTTDNLFNTGNTIKGGSGSSDIAHMSLGAVTLTKPTMSGFEKFELNSTGAGTIDLTNTTGLTNVIVTGAGTTISGLAAGVAVDLGLVDASHINNVGTSATDNNTVTVNLASITGTADALTVNLVNQSATDSGITVAATGVENFTFVESTAASSFKLLVTDTNATNPVTFTLTGGVAGQTVTFASGGIQSNVTNINGSAGLDHLVMATGARAGTTAMTITGGAGNDAIIMKHAADVLTAGAGTDTLSVVQNAVLGGFAYDLSSTVDQITTYNGSANAAVQVGFESIDLSGISGVFGSDITAVSTGSTITGTSNADVITGGAGNDIIVATAGNDAITGGNGTNIYRFDTAALFEARSAATATYAGGTGTDTLAVMAASTAGIDADLAGLTSVEQLMLTGISSIVLGSNATAAGLTTVITGAGATGVDGTVNADTTVVATALANTAALALSDSANTTNFTVTGLVGNITSSSLAGTLNVTTAATGGDGSISIGAGAGNVVVTGGLATDTITVTGLATASQTFSGTVAKFNVTGSTNAQTITTGTAADTVNGGAGADIIVITAGGNDVVRIAASEEGDAVTGFTAGAAADVLDISYALVSNDNTAADLADFAATKAVAANNFINNMTSLTIASSTGYAAGTSVILEIGSALGVLSALTTANFRSVFGVGGSAGALTVGTNNQGKFLVVAYNGTTAAADAALFLVDYSTDATAQATIHASDTVTLVGTFAGVGSNALTADNFL